MPATPAASRPHREPERSALPGLGLRPDAAAVVLHDPIDDREPDAGALELGGGVESLERLEELRAVARIEAHAVVDDSVRAPFLRLADAQLDPRLRLRPRELPC